MVGGPLGLLPEPLCQAHACTVQMACPTGLSIYALLSLPLVFGGAETVMASYVPHTSWLLATSDYCKSSC